MENIILGSDIAISAGGQTLYELARLGKPVIAVKIADNQMNNIKGLKRAGAIEYAGNWNEVNILFKIEKCIEELKDRAKRAIMSHRAASSIDGGGSLKIAKFLMKKAAK